MAQEEFVIEFLELAIGNLRFFCYFYDDFVDVSVVLGELLD